MKTKIDEAAGTLFRRRSVVAGGLAMLAAPGILHAQAAYPSKPVRVICAYGAGGTADIVSRIVFAGMSARLGQQFVIENRPGGAGQIAGSAVVHAAADGYTLLYDATAHSVNPSLFGARMPYDTERDLMPIFLSMVAPNTIDVAKGFGPRTVREMIDFAKASRNGLDCGTTGIGSAQHISIELLAQMAGIRLNHIVYRATPAARTDLMARRIDLQFGNVPGSVAAIQNEDVRVLAHAGLTPVDVLPGVEAIADTLPGYETYEWNGVFAPAGTSAEVIRYLNSELNRTIQMPDVAERLKTLGAITRANSPDECATFRRQQMELHGRIVRQANIRID
ncbi:MAG: Tripartite-type tricarboxylate transporter, receptor component TctC [Rubritepida sp.]|nr:Tripartite-type tricarboxylate transporter, receptor component TctC [Rubritepida sp.]